MHEGKGTGTPVKPTRKGCSVSLSLKTASYWTKFAELTISSIQADLGRADYLLQFPDAARAALEELIEEGVLTSSLDSFFKDAGWINTRRVQK